MIQALKVGFSNSSFTNFSAVSYRRTKLCCPFSAGLKMGSRKCSSASATAKLSDESDIDMSKPQMRISKTRNKKSGVLEDDSENIEKMTLQQIKSRLRCIGIPVKGAKNELLSTMKSYMDSQIDGAGSSALQDLVVSKDKPAATTRTNSKRKAKELPERDFTQIKKDDADISGVISEETSIQVKKKVLSRITAANIEAHVDVVVPIDEPWTVLSHKKPEKGWTAYNPEIMRPPPIAADMPHVKLMSWNVNGLRALLKLESFSALKLAKRENFDVLCLQETKLQEKDVDAIRQTLLEGYDNSYWTCSVSKLGYSGTAIISRIKPLSVSYGMGIADHDSEGRLVTVEFDNFYLLSGYVPNSGDGLRRLSYRITQWDPSLSNYMKDLEQSKPVILTGDLNCAHQEIDIWNPAGNKRSAGFTDEERQSFQTNFLDRGLVDTFRKQHPDIVGYTYWGYRHGGRKANKGWRLDYFLASESIANQVYDSYILPDVAGSDHSPIGLILKL